MQVVWDPPKRLANLDKHGLDFEELKVSFFAKALVRPAKRDRFQAIGHLNGRTVTVICAILGSEALSIISLRPANPAERRLLNEHN